MSKSQKFASYLVPSKNVYLVPSSFFIENSWTLNTKCLILVYVEQKKSKRYICSGFVWIFEVQILKKLNI